MAVLLNKFEDMSYADIAEVMGKSEPAVKSLLARARTHLREQLEPYLRDRSEDAVTTLPRVGSPASATRPRETHSPGLLAPT